MVTIYCILVLIAIYVFIEQAKNKKEIFVSGRNERRSPSIKPLPI